MAKKKNHIDVETLLQIERLGAPSLSPDGAQAVVSLASPSLADNTTRSALWLLSTLGGAPRRLTACGSKDGAPSWAPSGERIAFIAKREQEGHKDEEPQLYLIAPDGGEAQRAAEVATGVEAFRWCPNGRQIVFVSWVWPQQRGAKAQAKAMKAHKARKETGYATSEAQYRHWDHNLPQGRVPRLHLMSLGENGAPAKLRDLFEGTAFELTRSDPGANDFDISPDGRFVAFAFDPTPEKRGDGRFALAELELRSGKCRVLLKDADWNFGAPRYSPDGRHLAFLASHQAKRHTMPTQLARLERGSGTWQLLSADWDRIVQAPLQWEEDGEAVLFLAEEAGRSHLWRFDIDKRAAAPLVKGGWVSAFAAAAGCVLTLADSARHPARLHAQRGDAAPHRIERFNDALLATVELGDVEERWFSGALGDKVQMWLTYPPGFDAAQKNKTYPLLHNIHGGPHTGPGDNWHYRWNTQVFAAQGYVVASVNYHGSSGFGHAFLDSITHRWGELELQDIEAATTALLKKPCIDRQRVFAAGGSYGGYMVAWMNAHVQAGRYRAYVCHAGCFDWVGMFADDAWAWHAKELGAWYWDDMAKPLAQSPHRFAAGMQTPTLVIHGALDYRVPDAQGLAYYNTLKAKGVSARLLWYADENHWILKPQNSRQWYGEFFAWLQQHDAGAKKRPAAPKR